LPAIEIGRRVWIHGLERCLRRLAPDVVHCHNLLQFHSMRSALLRARRRAAFGLLVDDHMVSSVVRRSPFGRLTYLAYRHLAQPLVARNVDAFCAATLDTRTYLARECGVRGQIEVRPLGVDVDAFAPSSAARATWRRRLDLAETDLVYLYTGKLIEAKGPHLLVQAALQLLRRGEHLRVLLVGDADPAYLESIRAEARRAGLADHIRYHASVPHADLPGVYAAADVAVWPRQESMALFEAMSTGLPVIINSGSGYSFLAEAGAGLTFAPDDVSALAESMWALSTAAERSPTGARGRELAEADYSWHLSAERYLKSYVDILDHRAAR
jgi:glycosyltransferase involved in cell wall biosynthesis